MVITALVAAFLIKATQGSYRDRFPLPDLTVPAGWGLNANLKDLDDDDINEIADTGAKWVRLDLSWSRVESKQGDYNFSKYDPVVDGLSRKGIRAILILDYGNKLYDVDAPRTREGRTAFAAYAAAAVRHYKHRGVIWEIWNEPNLSHFWRGEPSADEYSALVRVAVPAMREESSDEWIMGPGTSRFDFPYLEGCFQKGILQDFDAVSIHPYRDLKHPETVAPDWDQLRSLIAKYAPSGKRIPMICSEWGYSTYGGGVSERTQGNYAVRCYLANLASGVPLTIWYSWKDRPDASSEKEQHFGLVDADSHPKGGHDIVANTLGALNGYTFDSRVSLGEDEDVALLFRKGMSQKVAAWTEDPNGKEVRFPANLAFFAGSSNRQIDLSDTVQVFAQK